MKIAIPIFILISLIPPLSSAGDISPREICGYLKKGPCHRSLSLQCVSKTLAHFGFPPADRVQHSHAKSSGPAFAKKGYEKITFDKAKDIPKGSVLIFPGGRGCRNSRRSGNVGIMGDENIIVSSGGRPRLLNAKMAIKKGCVSEAYIHPMLRVKETANRLVNRYKQHKCKSGMGLRCATMALARVTNTGSKRFVTASSRNAGPHLEKMGFEASPVEKIRKSPKDIQPGSIIIFDNLTSQCRGFRSHGDIMMKCPPNQLLKTSTGKPIFLDADKYLSGKKKAGCIKAVYTHNDIGPSNKGMELEDDSDNGNPSEH